MRTAQVKWDVRGVEGVRKVDLMKFGVVTMQ
jgi:hypothetical protein